MTTAHRIALVKSVGLGGEPARLFDARLTEGFWDEFVRPGPVIDVGYRGHTDLPPVFRDAIGLDVGTPGYNGRDFPFENESIGTIHASHLLEHVADYGHFFLECFRVLAFDGTLIIFVPLMEAYERRRAPPSIFNADHKRFYTASRLLFEIESSLPRDAYRIAHLCERFRTSDLFLPRTEHAVGPYEIECVIEKITPDGVY